MPLMVTAREKFWRGVDALASVTGSLQQRLAKAGNHIAGMHVRGDLSDELQSKYDELIASLTRVQSLEGSLKATAESLSETEASLGGQLGVSMPNCLAYSAFNRCQPGNFMA